MKFSLNNPEKLTNVEFNYINTEQKQKDFFQVYWTTLDSFRKLKSWEKVMLKVKQSFDEIFEWTDWTMYKKKYEKYNERSKSIEKWSEMYNVSKVVIE